MKDLKLKPGDDARNVITKRFSKKVLQEIKHQKLADASSNKNKLFIDEAVIEVCCLNFLSMNINIKHK